MTAPRSLRGRTAYLAGLAAEAAVERLYAGRGCAIVARRWRGSRGEIDLVARDGGTLVFVEVKAAGSRDRAAEALSPAQVARLFGAAAEYLAREPAGQDTPARFDVALVDGQGRIEILPNALIG